MTDFHFHKTLKGVLDSSKTHYCNFILRSFMKTSCNPCFLPSFQPQHYFSSVAKMKVFTIPATLQDFKVFHQNFSKILS